MDLDFTVGDTGAQTSIGEFCDVFALLEIFVVAMNLHNCLRPHSVFYHVKCLGYVPRVLSK